MELRPRADTTWSTLSTEESGSSTSSVSLAPESTYSSISSADSDIDLLTPGVSMIGGDEIEVTFMDAAEEEDEDAIIRFVDENEKERIAWA